MRRVCVFCGASPGRNPVHREAAQELALVLSRRNIGLVYGAASVGVMGTLADATLEVGGKVIGVIPERLVDRERSHAGLTELHVVKSMHERKALMGALSDGFIALPGGLGTMEEFFEVLTWNQLGIHSKPCGLLNVGGFYDGLTSFLDHLVDEGFVPNPLRSLPMIDTTPDGLLDRMEQASTAAKRALSAAD